MKFITENISQTKKIAKDLAGKFILMAAKERVPRGAVIIALLGELGSGKTTFVQGFAHGFNIKKKIISPTFVLMRKFNLNNLPFKYFYHIDCYRINNPRELLGLGLEEIFKDPQNIILIEWADKIRQILPRGTNQIFLKHIGEKKREIIFKLSKTDLKK